MSRWWECRVCAKDLGIYGEDCLDHRADTGHVGAQLMVGIPRPMEPKPAGSTAEGRARAKRTYKALRDRS